MHRKKVSRAHSINYVPTVHIYTHIYMHYLCMNISQHYVNLVQYSIKIMKNNTIHVPMYLFVHTKLGTINTTSTPSVIPIIVFIKQLSIMHSQRWHKVAQKLNIPIKMSCTSLDQLPVSTVHYAYIYSTCFTRILILFLYYITGMVHIKWENVLTHKTLYSTHTACHYRVSCYLLIDKLSYGLAIKIFRILHDIIKWCSL